MNDADHDAELLADDRENVIGVGIRQDALDRAFARPLPNQPPE